MVGDLGVLVHLTADPMADVLVDHAVTGIGADLFDRRADIPQPRTRADLGDPGPQRPLGVVDESLHLWRDVADSESDGGVTVVSLVNGPGVDGEDVAVLEPVPIRYPMDDDVVG